MKLEHVAINVPDPVEMAQWYVANLGMRIARSMGAPRFEHFIVDDSGQAVMEIYYNTAASIPDYAAMHPLHLHFAFLVEDMEAAHARLIEAGATAFGEIVSTPAGDQLAFLRDPWHVPLQLVKRTQPLVPSDL